MTAISTLSSLIEMDAFYFLLGPIKVFTIGHCVSICKCLSCLALFLIALLLSFSLWKYFCPSVYAVIASIITCHSYVMVSFEPF